MGQRLNVEIQDSGELLANAYYHWSGYTISAVGTAKKVVEDIMMTDMTVNELEAIRLLEATGAGIDTEELELVRDKYEDEEFVPTKGRNAGIINITEEKMNETRYWADATAIIDVGSETINIDAFYDMDKEEFMEDMDVDESKMKKYPKINLSYNDIPYNEIYTLEDNVMEIIDRGYFATLQDNGDVVQLIH